MKTVVYRFADGTKSEVQVDDELYAVIEEMEKVERSSNRRETRRHVSIESLAEKCIDPPTEDEYDWGELFQNINNERLLCAISRLGKADKDLLYKVYYEQMTLKEIAIEEKVSPQAISWRLNTILSQLRLNR